MKNATHGGFVDYFCIVRRDAIIRCIDTVLNTGQLVKYFEGLVHFSLRPFRVAIEELRMRNGGEK